MFKTENNAIYINRGNYGKLTVPLQSITGAAYTLGTGEKLVLIVRKTASDSKELIHFESPVQYFEFEYNDTASLDFGTYSYDITLVRADNRISTIVEPTDFVVGEANYRG